MRLTLYEHIFTCGMMWIYAYIYVCMCLSFNWAINLADRVDDQIVMLVLI